MRVYMHKAALVVCNTKETIDIKQWRAVAIIPVTPIN